MSWYISWKQIPAPTLYDYAWMNMDSLAFHFAQFFILFYVVWMMQLFELLAILIQIFLI
jgi:hypothetical protein